MEARTEFGKRATRYCAYRKSHSAVFTNVTHCYIALKTCHNINSPGTTALPQGAGSAINSNWPRRGWNLAESVSSGLKPHEAFLCGG